MPRSSKKIDELLHDIKSPLTSAIISCEEILEVVNADKNLRKALVNEPLCDLHESLRYIKDLINEGNHNKRFDVSGVISSSIKSAKKLSFGSCEIKFEATSNIPKVDNYFLCGNQTKFRRLINNILINAIEVSATAIDIKVKAGLKSFGSSTSKHFVIEISDNGSGIPKDKLEYIFDKGYSLKIRKFKTSRNCGLGLHICKSIIQKDFGGEISVKSQIGKRHGTKFLITFPFFIY